MVKIKVVNITSIPDQNSIKVGANGRILIINQTRSGYLPFWVNIF